jgi:glycosyltransferase involved in cell wall biosynthesis
MLRVLFLSNEYGVDRFGTAYAHRLEDLRCALQQRGIQTEFLSLREQPACRPLLVHPLNLPFIRKHIADCDFIHAGGDAAYTAALLKPFTRAAVIFDVHDDTFLGAQLVWRTRRDLRRAYWVIQAWIMNAISYRRADYFLAVAKPLMQRLVDKKHLPAHRIALIRNGVNLELFKPLHHVSNEGFTICYAGGFDAWHGIDLLVGALELLPKDHVRFKAIGFTGQHAALRSSIAGRLGDRVELLDRVSQRELVFHLATADVLVSTRVRHRATEVMFPSKFSEYLAVGRPVIVCDVDETASLVRKHRCGLVSEPNPAAMAETIRAASDLTRSELHQMGQNARRLAEAEFSWDQIGRKYADLLTRWSDEQRGALDKRTHRSRGGLSAH